eukprot:Skav206924  [mRNA]  locus=scaffold6623:5483:8324:- [translate_table: standard]
MLSFCKRKKSQFSDVDLLQEKMVEHLADLYPVEQSDTEEIDEIKNKLRILTLNTEDTKKCEKEIHQEIKDKWKEYKEPKSEAFNECRETERMRVQSLSKRGELDSVADLVKNHGWRIVQLYKQKDEDVFEEEFNDEDNEKAKEDSESSIIEQVEPLSSTGGSQYRVRTCSLGFCKVALAFPLQEQLLFALVFATLLLIFNFISVISGFVRGCSSHLALPCGQMLFQRIVSILCTFIYVMSVIHCLKKENFKKLEPMVTMYEMVDELKELAHSAQVFKNSLTTVDELCKTVKASLEKRRGRSELVSNFLDEKQNFESAVKLFEGRHFLQANAKILQLVEDMRRVRCMSVARQNVVLLPDQYTYSAAISAFDQGELGELGELSDLLKFSLLSGVTWKHAIALGAKMMTEMELQTWSH